MAGFGPTVQTAQVTTGSFLTTVDLYDTTKILNGAKNPLGIAYIDNPTTTANPNGVPTKYRYVQYKSTAQTTMVAFPAPVFWTDETFTVVSEKMSEAQSAKQSSLAGWLMPNTAALTGLTAALLNNNFCWIAVSGFVSQGAGAAGAAGDFIIGGATGWVPVIVASGTAPTFRIGGYLLNAASGSKADLQLAIESL